MHGIGNVVAFHLISDMPELGYLTNKQASVLVDVTPINRESGSYEGKRMIVILNSMVRDGVMWDPKIN